MSGLFKNKDGPEIVQHMKHPFCEHLSRWGRRMLNNWQRELEIFKQRTFLPSQLSRHPVFPWNKWIIFSDLFWMYWVFLVHSVSVSQCCSPPSGHEQVILLASFLEEEYIKCTHIFLTKYCNHFGYARAWRYVYLPSFTPVKGSSLRWMPPRSLQ